MSKVRRIVSKKVLDTRLVSHCSSNSLINPNANQMALNPKGPSEKSEFFSESPYAQKLIKARSSSNLKDPSFYQTSGITSPPLNPKFNTKPKLNLSNSFISKTKDPSEPNFKIKRKEIIKRESIDNQTYLIELKIDEIFQKHKENGITNEILERYKECLEEIIYKDKQFGELIAKIKFAYEDWIRSKFEMIADISKLKSEIIECNRNLNEEIEENKRLHKKVQKFSRENVELGRALEERDNNCKILQDHLLKITNISIEEVPQDKTSWKVLIAENSSYSDLCAKLKKKIKAMKLQEKKLMKLFWGLKQKGVPVEEYYENIMNGNNKDVSFNNSVDDASDYEALSVEPARSRIKPSNVPLLKMSKVEPNSFTDERNSDSDEISI